MGVQDSTVWCVAQYIDASLVLFYSAGQLAPSTSYQDAGTELTLGANQLPQGEEDGTYFVPFGRRGRGRYRGNYRGGYRDRGGYQGGYRGGYRDGPQWGRGRDAGMGELMGAQSTPEPVDRMAGIPTGTRGWGQEQPSSRPGASALDSAAGNFGSGGAPPSAGRTIADMEMRQPAPEASTTQADGDDAYFAPFGSRGRGGHHARSQAGSRGGQSDRSLEGMSDNEFGRQVISGPHSGTVASSEPIERMESIPTSGVAQGSNEFMDGEIEQLASQPGGVIPDQATVDEGVIENTPQAGGGLADAGNEEVTSSPGVAAQEATTSGQGGVENIP